MLMKRFLKFEKPASFKKYIWQIKGEVGLARVVDVRRPKLSVNLDSVTPEQAQEKSNLSLPGGVLAMSAAIVMASE